MSLNSAFIDCDGALVKVALVRDGDLKLLDADVLERPGQLDSIFAARVLRKELSSYWCDIGLARPGLLSFEKGFSLLEEGEKVLVQIKREAFLDAGEPAHHHFQKPVALTRNIVLAHQGCLYFALTGHLRARSTPPIQPLDQQRTVLETLFKVVEEKFATSSAPALLLSGPTVIERFLKELPENTPVEVATPDLMLSVKTFCYRYRPDLMSSLHLRRPNLFCLAGLDEAWQTCLESKLIHRKGSIVIETTACVTSIDVNASLSKAGEINQEILLLVAQQLIWRRLSGNVIIDFIADSPSHKQIIQQTLKVLLRADRPKWHILGWSPLGWLELQRSKRRLPLQMVLQLLNNKQD